MLRITNSLSLNPKIKYNYTQFKLGVFGLGPCVFAYKLYVAVDFVASAGMPQAAGEPENRRTTASVWHFWPLLGRLVRLRPSVCRHMLFVHSIAFGHVMQIISIGHNMCRKII